MCEKKTVFTSISKGYLKKKERKTFPININLWDKKKVFFVVVQKET